MSLEELRERNIQLVIEKALYCFTEQGIEHTKVKDIAREAGLTERSLFRYFATKADIIQAAAYTYWCQTLQKVSEEFRRAETDRLTGIEQIEFLLDLYCRLFLEDQKGTRFTLDAEVSLYNANRNDQVLNRPPEPYEISESPLVMAIHKGLADGSVNPKYDPKELYYNAYDSILGVLQRLAVETTSATDLDNTIRMKHLCEIFVNAMKGE